MGYRSQVAFIVKFDTEANAASYLEAAKVALPLIKEYLSDFEVTAQGYIVVTFDYIKWYDSYEDVQALTKFYKDANESQGYEWYLFKRIGENDDDYEEDWDEAEGCEYKWNAIEFTRALNVTVH